MPRFGYKYKSVHLSSQLIKYPPYFDQWASRALSGAFGNFVCRIVTNLKSVVLQSTLQ